MGTYTEKLSSGGELIIAPDSWKIRYYFPGPDMRYNGTLVEIPGSRIDEYIAAWKNNFKKYLQLKQVFDLNGSYETTGEAGMRIGIGDWAEGVCIHKWNMPVTTQVPELMFLTKHP